MSIRALLILLSLPASVFSFSQSISFGSILDTVYYTDHPVVSATLYPGPQSAGEIFGLKFSLSTSCGYFENDSVLLSACSELTYASSYLSITEISDGRLSYGITGIRPGFNLGNDIDSIHISLPLSGISPDDSLLTLSLDELIINDQQGITIEEEGSAKTVMLIRKPGNVISNPSYYRHQGIKTSYNATDGSISIWLPEEYMNKEYTVSVYDLSGRLLLNKEIYNPGNRIEAHNLMSGIYLLDVRFKHGKDYYTMSGKLIIP